MRVGLARLAPGLRRWRRRHRYGRMLTEQLARRGEDGAHRALVLEGRSVGFFSMVLQVLGALEYARPRRLRVVVSYTDGPFADPVLRDNWWTRYFERSELSFGAGPDARSVRTTRRENELFARLGEHLTPRRAHALLATVGIKPEILSRVSRFLEAHASERAIVGVHYRGTDKVDSPRREAVRVPYDDVMRYLERHADRRAAFFVATDEQAFLDAMVQRFGERVLHSGAARSGDGRPLHAGATGARGVRLGEEALVDSLLLSRCRALVRTESNLSLVSTFFNPDLPVVNLTDRLLFTSRAARRQLDPPPAAARR